MYCIFCGAQIDDNAGVCPQCHNKTGIAGAASQGADNGNNRSKEVFAPVKGKRKGVFSAILYILLAAVLMFFALYSFATLDYVRLYEHNLFYDDYRNNYSYDGYFHEYYDMNEFSEELVDSLDETFYNIHSTFKDLYDAIMLTGYLFLGLTAAAVILAVKKLRWIQRFTIGAQGVIGVVSVKGINAKARINLTYEQVTGAKAKGNVIELKTEDVTYALYARNASEATRGEYIVNQRAKGLEQQGYSVL